MTQPDKSWLDENGRHVRLDDYLKTWEGWNDLLDQLTQETGMDRGEAIAMIYASNISGVWNSIVRMADYFQKMTEYQHEASDVQRAATEAYSERRKQDDHRQEVADRLLEIAERQVEDSDGDAPWKVGERPRPTPAPASS